MLIQVIIVLVIVGVALYLINTYVPMAKPINIVLNVIVVLILVVWLLRAFGVVSFSGPLLR